VSKEFKIGLTVTSAIFMLYWGANFLSGNDVFSSEKAIFAKYQNLDGLVSSSGVNYKGMQVGSVKTIEFDSSSVDGYCWVVRFEVETDGIDLYNECIAEISSVGILGTVVVELSDINKGSSEVKTGDTLIGKLSPSLKDEVDIRLRPLQQKVDLLLEDVDKLVKTFVVVMDDKTQSNLKKSFEQIPLAMANILHATNSLDSITTDLKNAKVKRIVDHIESLTKTLSNNSSKISSIINNLDNITDSLAKSEIAQTITRVNDVLSETEGVMDKINRGEGTVGMLLNDKKLYDHLVLASADLDFLLLDLKQNPARYLNVSLINFGSKRQKPASGWDSTDYEVLKGNAFVLKKLNKELFGSLAAEIRDSCETPCDSLRLKQILEKYSK
jgi:phospholipid/cholesterol/gamma-HCH transport system substrate-binding protein